MHEGGELALHLFVFHELFLVKALETQERLWFSITLPVLSWKWRRGPHQPPGIIFLLVPKT